MKKIIQVRKFVAKVQKCGSFFFDSILACILLSIVAEFELRFEISWSCVLESVVMHKLTLKWDSLDILSYFKNKCKRLGSSSLLKKPNSDYFEKRQAGFNFCLSRVCEKKSGSSLLILGYVTVENGRYLLNRYLPRVVSGLFLLL